MPTAIGTYATTALAKEAMGITNAVDDVLIGKLADRVNAWIEAETGRVLAPILSAVYTLDGRDARDGRVMYIREGVRVVSLLQVASQTGGTLQTIPSTDYFLRGPLQPNLPTSPFSRIELTDVPSAGNPFGYFPQGYANVAVTMACGWAVIPDEIVSIALTAVAGAWTRRKEGPIETVIIGPDGDRTFVQYLSQDERWTLKRFTVQRIVGTR